MLRACAFAAGTAVLGTCLVMTPVGSASALEPSAFSTNAGRGAVGAPVNVDGMNLDSGGKAVVNAVERTEVVPGLVHVKFERRDPLGWQHINVLKATLSPSTVKMKYLSPETISGAPETVTELTKRADALAGVNLDRFDINNSYAPAGWGITDGRILKSGNHDAAASVGTDAAGLGVLVDLALEGSVTMPDGSTLPVSGINVTDVRAEGVAMYTSQWGSYTRTRMYGFKPANGVEVWIGADGTVERASAPVGSGADVIPEGVQVLTAKTNSTAATALATLSVGDRIEVAYGIRDDVSVGEIGGSWHRLLVDGRAAAYDKKNKYLNDPNPRTMIGFSQDRATAHFIVADGRTAESRGLTFNEMAELMLDVGGYNAMSADGGGSTQMNVRQPGDDTPAVVNVPSDGFERPDADGMGFVLAQPGTGALTGFSLRPVRDDRDALRVFPGTHRTLTGFGHDEMRTAVDARPDGWSSADATASVDHGVVKGLAQGTATITAASGSASGSLELEVAGPLQRMTVAQSVVNLETQGASAVLSFTGHDAEGFTAPIEAIDIAVDNPAPDVFSVTPTADGRFTVTATAAEGGATLAFTHGDVRAEVAVAVPLEVKLIDDFSDISGWTTAHDRAANGSIAPGEGHEGAASIRVNYDFTQSTGIRGRYAVAPGAVEGGNGGIDIPGRPQKLSVWIKGDGNGSLLRLQVMQLNGVRSWLDGVGGSQSLYVTWKGWQRHDFVVPHSFAFPLKFERIRVLETVAAKQYKGSLEFSKIYAYLPPVEVAPPAVAPANDSLVVAAGETSDAPLRVAVMSDAQFVAREPESGAVLGARKALREIVAQSPDVLVINGDFVDEGSPEDFALARRILDEELADARFPWYYVPGNHEIMGAPISNFEKEFGATSNVFDLNGTRFITANSATGAIGADFAQVKMIREQLDDAAVNPAITGVVFLSHMPTNDPLPAKASQLSDRTEAAMIDDWFEAFRANSGKSIAYISGHVGAFDTSRSNGVPHVVNGNSGKGPAAAPDDGGFTGWTMLGIDPARGMWEAAPKARAAAGGSWLSVETRPRVDADGIAIAAPAELAPGAQAALSAQFAQDADVDGTPRIVSVAWPISSAWAGEGVFHGAPADAPADAVVAVQPEQGVVTALRAGTAQLQVTVNGETARHTLVVPSATGPVDPGDPGDGSGGGSGDGGNGGAGEGNTGGAPGDDLATTGAQLGGGIVAVGALLLGAGLAFLSRARRRAARANGDAHLEG